MKKILFSLFILASFTVFAQQSNSIVMADGMIASVNFIKANKSNIKSQKTYNSGVQLPKSITSFGKTSTKNVIAIDLKDNYYDKITLAELNEQFKLSADNAVLVDGNLFENTSTKIFGDVLINMEVKSVNGNNILSISSK